MSNKDQVLAIVRERGVARAEDVENAGLSRNYLYELHKKGRLIRLSRGLYTLPGQAETGRATLAAVARRAPKAVVCLLSALNFHELTSQIPHEVWIAVPRGAWPPEFDYPPLDITHVSGEAYSYGIEKHNAGGTVVKVYNPAKTVADCFKFRCKVGLDVAVEALRETWRARKAGMDELVAAAKVCKVLKVVRPYLEAIV